MCKLGPIAGPLDRSVVVWCLGQFVLIHWMLAVSVFDLFRLMTDTASFAANYSAK